MTWLFRVTRAGMPRCVRLVHAWSGARCRGPLRYTRPNVSPRRSIAIHVTRDGWLRLARAEAPRVDRTARSPIVNARMTVTGLAPYLLREGGEEQAIEQDVEALVRRFKLGDHAAGPRVMGSAGAAPKSTARPAVKSRASMTPRTAQPVLVGAHPGSGNGGGHGGLDEDAEDRGERGSGLMLSGRL